MTSKIPAVPTTLTIRDRDWNDGVHTLDIVLDGPNGTYSGPQQVGGIKSLSDAKLKAAVSVAWGLIDDDVVLGG